MRLTPGALVGPYEVLSVIGTGGMGEVYLARDARLDRRVAIKARQLDAHTSSEDRRRVLHEGRAAARLSHPGIASVFDVIEDGETSFLVMEYVEGRSLRALLTDGPLPLARAVGLGLDLCNALAAAHAHGVVHGDVKPENICITHDGRLKVLDFGIARITADPVSAGAEATRSGDGVFTGRFAGTPQYAAPEQFEGQRASIASDVYSTAGVIFEMLTGRPPFTGRDALEIGLQAVRTDSPRADAVLASVPLGIADVLAAGLARDVQQRLDSIEALAQALADAHDAARAIRNTPGRLLLTPPPAAPIQTTPLPRTASRTTVAWVGTIVAVLAIAALTASWMAWRRGSPAGNVPATGPPPVVAVLPLDNVGAQHEHAYLGTGIADTLIASLASVPGVTVVARGSSSALVQHRSDLKRVARDLGASFVVDGSVQTSGGAVRVTLTLVRADASVAWGQSFDGRLDRVFELYQRIAAGLGDALTLRLSAPERARLERPATLDIDALSEYAAAQDRLARADLAGNLAQAIDGFQRALARDPSFALAHAGLSEAYLVDYRQTGGAASLQRAIESAQQASTLAPYQAQTHTSLGNIYVSTGRHAEARQSFERAIALQPANDEAYCGLGMALAGGGARDEATAAFTKALQIRPGFWRNHHEFGRFLYSVGRYDEAAAEFAQVIALQPDSPRGYQALGTVYQTQGKRREAIEQYRRAASIGPSVNLFLNIGTLEHWEGRYAEAVASFEKAAGLAPEDPAPLRNIGDSRLKMHDVPGARSAYSQALVLAERQRRADPSVRAMQAVLLAKLGRYAEAEHLARQCVGDAPTDADASYSLAVVLALAGKHDQAWPVLEQAFAAGASPELADQDDDLEGVRAHIRRRFSEQEPEPVSGSRGAAGTSSE